MTPSDQTLASQAANLNDTDAFSELVRRYQSRILLLQQRLTGERALAEDLAQETFLRAWQKIGSYSGSGSFGGWISQLSFNVFRQHHRGRRRVRDEVPLDDLELSAPARDDASLADLERLLSALDREDQIIMTLTYGWGLTNPEVGEALGMPAGTVKARIHRAKATIRERFDTAGNPPGGSTDNASRTVSENSGKTARRRQPDGYTGNLTGACQP